MRVIVTDNYKIPDYRNQLHRFLKDGYIILLTEENSIRLKKEAYDIRAKHKTLGRK
jgi:hypothetical protein